MRRRLHLNASGCKLLPQRLKVSTRRLQYQLRTRVVPLQESFGVVPPELLEPAAH
jgi:hypothetical protein